MANEFKIKNGLLVFGNSDFGDFDLTSIDKLEGFDAAVYIDMGADGVLELASDTTLSLTSAAINLVGAVNVTGAIETTTTITFDAEVNDGDSGLADTIDWTTGNKHKTTLSDNCTYTFTAPPGVCNLTLKAVNFGSFFPMWPPSVLWAGRIEPTWTAGGTDIVSFYYDGSTYYGAATLDFS